MEFVKHISLSWFGDANFFRFQHPELAFLFLIPLGYSILFFYQKRNDKKTLEKFFGSNNLLFSFPNQVKGRSNTHFILSLLALFFLTIAAMNPQFGSKKEEVLQKGIDLVFALDVSTSMLAEDIKPNRLERSKHAISKIIDRLGADRIAIVVFAGGAYLQLPLTNDHAAAKMYLDEISTDILPYQGTSVAEALKKAVAALPKDAGKGAAIILITDGENHDEQALEIAKECGEKGLNIHCLGIGTAQGSTIPDYVSGKKVGLKKDKKGSTIVSRLNEELLLEIADNSGGHYIRSSAGSLGLNELYDQIRGMDQQEYGAKKFTLYEDRFPIFISLGLIFLLADLLLFQHQMRRENEN